MTASSTKGDPVDDHLSSALRELLRSGWRSNPAARAILDDYTDYHATLIVVGGLFTVGLAVLVVALGARIRRLARSREPGDRFEKRALAVLAAVAAGALLFMALVVVANASTVLDPVQGFAPLVEQQLPSPANASLRQGFDEWVRSGTTSPPPLVTERVHERALFHATRAVVAAAVLVLTVVLGLRVWRSLTVARRSGHGRWTPRTALLAAGATVAVSVCLFTMLAVTANVQGAVAPLAMTLVFG